MPSLGRIGLFVLAVALVTAACSSGPPPSFDPRGDCTTDATIPDEFSLDACTWAGFNPLVRFVVKK